MKSKISVTVTEMDFRGRKVFRLRRRIGNKVERKIFKTFAEAEMARLAVLDKLESRGTEAFRQAPTMTVAQGWQQFCRMRMPKLKVGNHTRLLNWWWGHFVAEFGAMELRDIKAIHIDSFLSRPRWCGTTANQGFVYLRLVWRWMVRYELTDFNPVIKIDVPKAAPEHHLLTVAQVRRLLDLTEGNDRLRAWFVLCLFGAMRVSEVGRCLPEHIEAEEIFVPIRKSTDPKPKPRFVPILPALRRHLPGKWDHLSENYIKRGRTKLAHAMGWDEWPQNCLRHTGASMHRAMWQDSNKTAYFLGHSSPRMVDEKYARAVRQAEAAKFWAL